MKNKNSTCSRQSLLKGMLATPALVVATSVSANEESSSKKSRSSLPLPTRKLGRNGPEVSMLAMGGQAEALTPEYYDKAWDMGIRYFDVADCYRGGQSERELGKWLRKYPERRGDVFIVSKDHPRKLSDLPRMLDKRLEVLGTDYLDAFLIHGLGAKEYGEESYDWPKSPEFKKISERLKASGKTRLMGFSCHDLQSDRYLHAAAEGGFVDVILLHSSPFHQNDDGADRALEACYQVGIGLVGMKVMRNAAKVPKRIPEFDELGLTTHQAAMHAVWSDHRFAACCIWIANEEQMAMNTEGARLYKKPLLAEHKRILHDVILAHEPALCPGCPSCKSFAETHGVDLKSISRYVAYYEQDGSREAKRYYQALSPTERDMEGLDLVALQNSCAYNVNYPDLVRRAEYYFG